MDPTMGYQKNNYKKTQPTRVTFQKKTGRAFRLATLTQNVEQAGNSPSANAQIPHVDFEIK